MTPIIWTNERRKIADLKPADYNPRFATEKEVNDLNASLDQFNLADPIVINKGGERDNVIIGGHFRVRIMQARGVEECDVRVPNRMLTLEEEMRLNLRLNKNGGQFDNDQLANFDEIMLKEVGFDALELDKIFELTPDRKEQADHAPALRPETTIQPGDVFQLGSHRIMCGDSTKPENLKTLLGEDRAQMVFTDPPYNVDYRGGNARPTNDRREGIANDNMSKGAFYDFLAASLSGMFQFTDGAFYICMSSSEMDTLMRAFEDCGGHWSNTIIWVKNAFTLGRSDYQHQYEPILYGWREGQKHYFVDQRHLTNVWEDLKEIKTKFDGEYTTIAFQGFKVRLKGEIKDGEVCRGRTKTNIWRYDKPSRSDSHPTMKPVALVCEAIRNSSEREQIVLGTFLGSGTTLMACEIEHRACRGMEMDPVYVQCAIDRWEEYTGQKAVKLEVAHV